MRLLFLLFLASCSTPSPDFILANAPHKTVQVRANTFKVYYLPTRAQAIRENSGVRAPVEVLQAQALVAMAQVTGCRVLKRSVKGDAVRTDAGLNCKGK